MSTFEEILEQDRRLIYKTRGVSMLPMLHQNRDIIVIVPAEGRLKKYDTVLYKRGSSYILHRIVGVRDGEYLIRGDNTYHLEHVPQDAVIGVLTGFVRNGKSYTVEDTGYQIYCRVWNAIYPLRKLMLGTRRIAGKTARMLGLRRLQPKK